MIKYETFVRQITKHINDEINDNHVVPFFFTVTYKPYEKFNGTDPIHAKSVLKSFENGYANLTSFRHLLGNNWSRPNKQKLKPITYAWLDYPHTKWKRTTDGQTGFSKLKLDRGHPESTPHIHSIMLIHPKTLVRFEALGADGLKRLFREVDTRVMTTDLREVHNVKGCVEYSSALIKYPLPGMYDQDLYTILPDQNATFRNKTERQLESDQQKEDRKERKRLDEMVAMREKFWKQIA